MDGPRKWELLCSIVPPILELAKFYTGDDPEAVSARDEIEAMEAGRVPFFANFQAELQSLDHHCHGQKREEEELWLCLQYKILS
jgi:hypothetical protein